MTDKELLEAAARAAGIDVRWHEPWETFVHVGEWYEGRPLMHKAQMMWNPLTDDGDALRLAVKLNFKTDFDTEPDGAMVYVYPGDHHGHAPDYCLCEWLGKDPYAATRRAIVRAAASIGQAQERNSNG